MNKENLRKLMVRGIVHPFDARNYASKYGFTITDQEVEDWTPPGTLVQRQEHDEPFLRFSWEEDHIAMDFLRKLAIKFPNHTMILRAEMLDACFWLCSNLPHDILNALQQEYSVQNQA